MALSIHIRHRQAPVQAAQAVRRAPAEPKEFDPILAIYFFVLVALLSCEIGLAAPLIAFIRRGNVHAALLLGAIAAIPILMVIAGSWLFLRHHSPSHPARPR